MIKFLKITSEHETVHFFALDCILSWSMERPSAGKSRFSVRMKPHKVQEHGSSVATDLIIESVFTFKTAEGALNGFEIVDL